MRGKTLKRISAIALLSPAMLAMTSGASIMTLQPGSRLWVEGTSTVRGFSCAATQLDVTVEAIGAGTATAVANASKAVNGVEVVVPAAKLDCKNGTMNEHLMKAIKGKDAPVITFKLASYELAKAAAGTTIDMKGTLSLGGVTKPVTVQATAKAEAGALKVTGVYPLKMTEWSLKPPSLMMGTMKVNENVKVNFDLTLKD